MTIKLKIIIKLLFVLSCFLTVGCKEKSEEFTFFVAGHVYGSPNKTNLGIHSPFKKCFSFIDDSKAGFIVFTGDMVKKPTNEDWNAFETDVSSLKTPIIMAPGNHDMGNRKLYKERNGSADSIFNINGNFFITFDNTKNGWGLDSMQLSLIEKAIDEVEKDKNIFIFMHNVIWHTINDCFTPNSLTGKAPEPYFNYWIKIEPLLKESKKNIYLFAGDVGATTNSKNISYLKDKNLQYITSGMGSGNFDNFLKITVRKFVEISVITLSLENNNQPIKNFTCY